MSFYWQCQLLSVAPVPGSRSGGLTAATWASVVYHGEEGYLKAGRAIMTVADKIKAGIEAIPELILNGDPTFVISFRSEKVGVFHINDFMKTKGWSFLLFEYEDGLCLYSCRLLEHHWL